jgi:hypothetical protein
MYWLGSVGCVGSWFFISATSRVRKSLAVMVEVDELEDELSVLLDEDEDCVDVARGRAREVATLEAESEICCALVGI